MEMKEGYSYQIQCAALVYTEGWANASNGHIGVSRGNLNIL